MTTQEQYIERIKELVANKFGQPITSIDECLALNDAIFEATGTRCDSDILAELYLANERPIRSLRPATLSTLARYIGYAGWSSFCTSSEILPAIDTDIIPVRRRWGTIILTSTAIIVVIATVVVLLRSGLLTPDSDGDDTVANIEYVDAPLQELRDMWVAATNEHCNALREYIATDTSRITAEIKQEMTTLAERIVADIEGHIATEGITMDDDTIARNSDIITNTCMEIYNSLLADIEPTPQSSN